MLAYTIGQGLYYYYYYYTFTLRRGALGGIV